MQHGSWFAKAMVLTQSPRLWVLASALLMRGAGFLASFMVARWAGPAALGLYSATVNTAGAVVQPVLGVITNGTTLSAGASVHSLGLRRLLNAYLLWVSLALLVLGLVLYQSLKVSGLFEPHGHPNLPVPLSLLVLTGVAVMAGSLLTAAASGLMAGAGQFLPLAKVLSAAAVLLMLMSYPAVAIGGLDGALALACFSACLPALLAMSVVYRLGRRFPGSLLHVQESAWQESRRHLAASAPTVVAGTLNSAVNWVCTIYLVQSIYGAVGVAVVAVGTQWLTLMLMPVTSWGPMVLKEMLAERDTRSRAIGWRLLSRLISRNLLVTVGVTAVVGVLASVIARAYNLDQHGLQVILWVSIVSALTAAVTNVLERLFVCEDRQLAWMVISGLGLVLQLAVTWAFIGRGLWVVPAGGVLSNVVIGMLAVFWRQAWPLRGHA